MDVWVVCGCYEYTPVVSIHVHGFGGHVYSLLSGVYPRVGLTCTCAELSSYCRIVFQSDHIILYVQQQRFSIRDALHPYQHLILSRYLF